MSTHLITMSVVMEEMDGSPEQSAEILATDAGVLMDYWEAGVIEFTAEDITPAEKDWNDNAVR